MAVQKGCVGQGTAAAFRSGRAAVWGRSQKRCGGGACTGAPQQARGKKGSIGAAALKALHGGVMGISLLHQVSGQPAVSYWQRACIVPATRSTPASNPHEAPPTAALTCTPVPVPMLPTRPALRHGFLCARHRLRRRPACPQQQLGGGGPDEGVLGGCASDEKGKAS